MKQLVVIYGNGFSYKCLVIIILEWPDYSLVKCLENAGAVLGGKTCNMHSFCNCVLGMNSMLIHKK
jgi:hypothetical protein